MKSKSWAVVALAGALVLGAVAIGVRQRGAGRAPGSGAVLRLGVQDNVVCALPFIAAHNGFFAREGLDVRIMRYASGKLALQAMFDGEVDVAACADMPVTAASFEREDFAVFGTIASTDRAAWILARRDRGIATPQDLRGKTVATQRDSAVHFFLSAFLARHGIGEHQVELRFMRPDDMPQALVEGRIDAFSMRNPYAAQARAALGGQALEMFDRNLYRNTFNLVTWRESLDSRAELCARLLRALVRAENFLVRNAADARRAVIAELGPQREAEVRSDWDHYTFTLGLDQSIFVALEDQARWAMDQSPLLRREMPNFLPFVDLRPLLAVKPAAVSIIR